MIPINAFRACRSIHVDRVEYTLVEPPTILGIPLIDPGDYESEAQCVNKAPGSLDIDIAIQGLTIRLGGTFLGVDRRGRYIVRWRAPGPVGQRIGIAFVEEIVGRLIGEVVVVPRIDRPDCANNPGRFFVAVRFIPDEDRADEFDASPNEFRIFVTGVTSTLAKIRRVNGIAGIPAPPPTPWPQPQHIRMNRWCVPSAATSPTVSGAVQLSDAPEPDQPGGPVFAITFEAEGLDPRQRLDVGRIAGTGRIIEFEVVLPPELTGRVRVAVFTNDRSRAISTQFSVGSGLFGCQAPDDGMYIPIRLGCEPIDCGWTGLNDRGTLVGLQGGEAVIRLAGEAPLERIGRGVEGKARIRALNNRNEVAGTIDRGDGTSVGFVEGPDEFGVPRLRLIDDVIFTALNDSSVATGVLEHAGKSVPIRWREGKVEPLDLQVEAAMPLAIDGAGNVAGIWTGGDGKGLRAFSLVDGAFGDLGELPGDVIGLHLNGAGAVAATIATTEGLRGVLLAAQERVDIPLPDDADGLAVAGINDQGIVAVTVRSGERSRAARFIPGRGLEFLDRMTNSSISSFAEAVAINNLGQILVTAGEGAEAGSMLLTPVALPVPEESSHPCGGCARPGILVGHAPPAPASAGPDRLNRLILLLLVLILALVLALLLLAT